MSDFENRLKQAIQRGKNRSDAEEQAKKEKELSAEELRRKHTAIRLTVSEHIEKAISQLADHFPGFRVETMFGEKGWGAACYRDDIDAFAGKRNNLYSRLEVTVRPLSEYNVVDLAAKGTIHNKELFKRQHFEEIADAKESKFIESVDTWLLEFAELFAAQH